MAEDTPPYYVTDTVRVEVRYFLQNNNAANVFHVGYTTPPGLADFGVLGSTISDWLTSDWKPLSSQDWSANQIIMTDLGGPVGKRMSFAVDPEVIGSDVAQAMPANVTAAVKFDTGIRGRGRSGRMFWIGLSEAGVDANQLIPGSTSGILAALNNLNALITALDVFTGMVVPNSFQTRSGIQHHLNPATSNLVEAFAFTDNLVDSQKDRLPFHKKHKRKVIIAP
jgi:hypothetical protein